LYEGSPFRLADARQTLRVAPQSLESRPMSEPSLYDQVGGMPFFERVVDRFYEGVRRDDVLLPLYPDQGDHLAGARRRLTLFLVQFTTYLAERGHPRLRARHFPFSIGALERDRWLHHMREAIDASDAPPDARARLHEYVTMAADAMRNRDEAPPGG
jgi:hemoglobin